MADISETLPKLRDRDVFYFRQRNKNRLFEKLVTFFASEAERTGITKKDIAARLGRDPSQITRWLSAPNNLTPDSISDLLLALGAEMDYEVAKFEERPQPNYEHPLISELDAVVIAKPGRPSIVDLKVSPATFDKSSSATRPSSAGKPVTIQTWKSLS